MGVYLTVKNWLIRPNLLIHYIYNVKGYSSATPSFIITISINSCSNVGKVIIDFQGNTKVKLRFLILKMSHLIHGV